MNLSNQKNHFRTGKALKAILFSATFLFLMPFISTAQKNTLEFDNAESAMKTVKNYVDALESGDVKALVKQVSKEVMVYGLGGGLDSLNYEQHKNYFKESTDNYKQTISQDVYIPIKVTDNWNEGEWVLAWGTNTAIDKKSGNKIVIPYHIAFIVEKDKITKIYYFYDLLNVVESQGYTLTEPKK